jgi:hypothetical protein
VAGERGHGWADAMAEISCRRHRPPPVTRWAPSNGCPYRNRQIGRGLKASSEMGPIDRRRGSVIRVVAGRGPDGSGAASGGARM